MARTVAVIGIGQSLRGDDAVGLEAIRQWQERYQKTATRSEVRVEACELPGLALLDLFNDAESVILVDAVQSGANAGFIHRLNSDDLSAFESDSKSAHGWGVSETLELAKKVGMPLPRLRLIGIEAKEMTIGTSLSADVENALPNVCEMIEEEVQSLL